VTVATAEGLSRPYFASKAALAAGVMAFSLEKGPPGTARETKKVMVITTQTVKIARKSRFKIYPKVFAFINFILPFPKSRGVYDNPKHWVLRKHRKSYITEKAAFIFLSVKSRLFSK
jgi:hypothetical protein